MAQNSKKRKYKKSKIVKKKSSVKKKSKIVYIKWIVGVFAMISALVLGYYLGTNQVLESVVKPTIDNSIKKIEKKIVTNKKQKSKQIKPTVNSKKRVIIKKKNRKKRKNHSHKPKLAIIIDDVSKKGQIKRIRALDMNITPSIFPPSRLNMHSHLLAKNLRHYMIHLPMESGSRQFNKQYKTLLTSHSQKQLKKRVKELRRLFPHAKYINNHTGSVFTSNYKAMYRLYKLLRKEKFIFVDSRTSGHSKVKKITRAFRDRYIARDIFIDNIHTISAIHKQLKKAVRVAKKKGYCVAIGHPHKVTMKALRNAKNLLKDVELVYIDTIYKKR